MIAIVLIRDSRMLKESTQLERLCFSYYRNFNTERLHHDRTSYEMMVVLLVILNLLLGDLINLRDCEAYR